MKMISLLLLLSYSALATDISLNKSNWKVIEYSDIKPNKVKFDKNKVLISVNSSAGSIAHTFTKPKTLSKLKLNISHTGNIKLAGKKQGEKKSDDYLLRVGVIYEGNKKLSSFSRLFAAQWLINIYDSAPKESGLSQVYFYNLVSDKRIHQKERVALTTDMFYENFKFLSTNDQSKRLLEMDLDKSKRVIGLWLCFDGDDTNSNFNISISDLSLTEE